MASRGVCGGGLRGGEGKGFFFFPCVHPLTRARQGKKKKKRTFWTFNAIIHFYIHRLFWVISASWKRASPGGHIAWASPPLSGLSSAFNQSRSPGWLQLLIDWIGNGILDSFVVPSHWPCALSSLQTLISPSFPATPCSAKGLWPTKRPRRSSRPRAELRLGKWGH